MINIYILACNNEYRICWEECGQNWFRL